MSSATARNAQLATYALSLIALGRGRKRGPLLHLDHEGLPGRDGVSDGIAAVAGHSLGEYTALVAAGALEAGAGAALVQARGEAMQVVVEANPGTMAAVLGLDLAGVAEACAEAAGAWVANDNTPGQVVVAGTLDGVEQAGAAALRLGAKRVVPLQVGGAFHTPLMQPAQASLRRRPRRGGFCLLVASGDRQRGRLRPHGWLRPASVCTALLASSAGANPSSLWRVWGRPSFSSCSGLGHPVVGDGQTDGPRSHACQCGRVRQDLEGLRRLLEA